MPETYEVAVIGAGVFGAWAAYELVRAGKSVVIVDAYGPANSRASSGGESRIIRMGYGPEEIYTRWSMRALQRWVEFFSAIGDSTLFHRTGVLWTAPEGNAFAQATREVLARCGAKHEELSGIELAGRFPQFRFDNGCRGIFEPDSGVLMARRAVQAVVRDAVRGGAVHRCGAVLPPCGKGRLDRIRMIGGAAIEAGAYVFACGPWLPKLFPGELDGVIEPTRQEIFFFGLPPGDTSCQAPNMPAWIDFSDARRPYTVPSLEGRGLKLGFDAHGPSFDPDRDSRITTAAGIQLAQAFVAGRFIGLAGAPLVETRVCQYENGPGANFILDRHPAFENVWVAGGGSGHGFKHGPAVGEHVARLVQGVTEPEARFRFPRL